MNGFTVLLVSDDGTWVDRTQLLLEQAECRVLAAPEHRRALEMAARRMPDAVVQDLPLLSASEELLLPRRVRALSRGSDVLFIAVSDRLAGLGDVRGMGYRATLAKSGSGRLPAVIAAQLTRLAPSPIGRGRPILLVDDDSAQRRLLRLVLSRWGFRVEEARSAREALIMVHRSSPAAVVSDFLMPETDGFSLCSAIKRDRRLTGLPVIVVSSILLDDRQMDVARELGVDAFVGATPGYQALARALVDCLDRPL